MTRDFFLTRLYKHKDNSHCDILLVYASGHTPHLEKLAASLETEFQANLMPDEVIIIVSKSSLSSSKALLESSRIFARRVRNSIRVKYHLCSFNSDGVQDKAYELKVKDEKISFPKRPSKTKFKFNELYREVITNLYLQYDANIGTANSFHYIKPSGRHSNVFLRASKMFSSTVEVSFFALATLNKLQPLKNIGSLDAILIDTPAMMSLAYSLIDLLTLTSDNFDRNVEIVSFRSFLGVREDKNILRTLKEVNENTLILISASTSCGLAKELKNITKLPSKNIGNFLFLNADDNGEEEFGAVCDLYFDKTKNPSGITHRPVNFDADVCELCTYSSAVQLLGDHFEAAPPKPTPVTIKMADAPNTITKFHELAVRVFANESFQLGTSKYDRSKVRHFHVDSQQLLSSERIQKRLNYNLDLAFPHDPQALIYIDQDSNILAEYILNRYKTSKIVSVSREHIEKELPVENKLHKPLVICATVIESGRTLLEISRILREITPNTPLIYIVVLAKTVSAKRLKTLKSSLSLTNQHVDHRVIIIENIVLPTSTQNNAWLREENFIKLQKLDDTGKYWRDRLSSLSKESNILDSGSTLFLTNSDKPVSQIKLQQNFAFFPNSKDLINNSSNTDIYFCLASVLQNLRTRDFSQSKNSLKSDIYQQGVLSAENFTRYNDSVLQACLLRAALPSELNYLNHHDESREIARVLKRLLLSTETKRGASAMEFLLALGTRQLKLQSEHVEDIMKIPDTDIQERRVRVLRKVVSKRLFDD